MSDNLPERPIFIGGGPEWRKAVLDSREYWTFKPIPAEAQLIATAVFRAAALWADRFADQTEMHIHTWAEVFARHLDWLTVDLAERGVHAHMRQSITGWLVVGHVLKQAALLRAEQEAS